MTPRDVFTDEVELDQVAGRLAAAMQPGRNTRLTIAREQDEHCCRVLADDVFNQPPRRLRHEA